MNKWCLLYLVVIFNSFMRFLLSKSFEFVLILQWFDFYVQRFDLDPQNLYFILKQINFLKQFELAPQHLSFKIIQIIFLQFSNHRYLYLHDFLSLSEWLQGFRHFNHFIRLPLHPASNHE